MKRIEQSLQTYSKPTCWVKFSLEVKGDNF